MNRFDSLFAQLRRHFARHESRCVVLHDDPTRYYLGTQEVREKDGYRTWLGGVEIRKNYVSAHLVPVYVHPDLLADISVQLRRRMQGKSCFNFKATDPVLLEELGHLVDAGVARFREEGRLH